MSVSPKNTSIPYSLIYMSQLPPPLLLSLDYRVSIT